MGLWIRPSKKNQENLYLYLRETIYKRDKRTLKKVRGKGNLSKDSRGKYSKKKDIYCGKIVEAKMVNFTDFRSFIENKLSKDKDFLEYKMKTSFDEILNDYLSFVFHVYNLDKDTFLDEEFLVYQVGNGYLCKQTLEFVKRFVPKTKNLENSRELERFANRCQDAGIFDMEVILMLYLKLFPEEGVERFEEDLLEYQKSRESKIEAKDMYDFLKKTS